MKKEYVKHVAIILLLFCNLSQSFGQRKSSEYFRDESASGARASMGFFSSPFNKYFIKNVFRVNPSSIPGHLISVTMSAASYQTIYFDNKFGVEVDPFVLDKPWKGFWTGYLAGEGAHIFLRSAMKSKYMDYIFASTLLATMTAITVDGEMYNNWRIAKDSPLNYDNLFSNRNSYWTHFAATGGLYWMLSNYTRTPTQAWLYTIGFVWLWEYKDGYLRSESKFNYLGGDGFSVSDAAAGILAATGSYLFDCSIAYIFKGVSIGKNYSVQVGPQINHNGLSVTCSF